MKYRVFTVLAVVILLMGVFCVPVSADEGVYEVSDFGEFKAAVEEINGKTSDTAYTIRLTGDINFGQTGYNCKFLKNTTILGGGHTINLGSVQSNGQLLVMGGTLSLGQNNSAGSENQLTITAAMSNRSAALILIGNAGNSSEKGTLNMYGGVELTGGDTNGASLGSAVNISNGEFNMYGGDIHGNTNDAISGMGGAVAGDGRNRKVVFNMYGGAIRDNKTVTNYVGYGGGVFLFNGVFNMEGGSIRENTVEKTTENARGYGGGVMMYGGKAVLSGGEILNNTSSNFGGGVFTSNGAELVIKRGFVITGNKSSVGGGLSSNGNSAVVEEGAVLANNKAVQAGDDVAHYGESLTLAPAHSMNMLLSTDQSNQPITGWYLDYPRWQADSAQEIDVTAPMGKKTTFLKAAYANTYIVIYRFVSKSEGQGLPDEVVDLLPIDTQEYQLGEQVTPIMPERTKVPVTGGVWEFQGYDAENKRIESVTTEFVGAWSFKPDAAIDDANGSSATGTPSAAVENKENKAEKASLKRKNSVKQTVKSPKTGDENNVKYYIFLSVTALLTVVVAFVGKRKVK